MDTVLDYVYDLRSSPLRTVAPPRLFEGAEIRFAEDGDLDELISVARASFQNHFGRFHADERISGEQAVRVYEEWIKSSCRGYADWVLVAKMDGRIAGYSVWRKPSSFESDLKTKLGHYSIGAVHPDYYGRGFFSALTFHGMRLFQGVADCIEGPTHVNNYQIQRAYDKLHWRVRDARHSFHKWLIM
jgi:ribosomal protein S18 acetylase RimI-like enzyme